MLQLLSNRMAPASRQLPDNGNPQHPPRSCDLIQQDKMNGANTTDNHVNSEHAVR
jgi:hypothetical protein